MNKRDYTKIKGYENLTNSDARHRYLHDLLRQYMGLTVEEVNQFTPCKRVKATNFCQQCTFTHLLGSNPAAPCCWKAEADPDYAIECLEDLLGVTPEAAFNEEFPNWYDPKNQERVEKIEQILDYYPHDGQMLIAQEECAELIKAISKWQRALAMGDGTVQDTAMGNLIEEIADVRIMCAQLQLICGIGNSVGKVLDAKLDRTLERIELEKINGKKKKN